VDDVTWGALTLTLTLLGGIYTWLAYQRRGLAAGLRGAGFTLIPVALLLTDTLKMVTRIADAVGDWALHLVFNPFMWAGIVLAGVSMVCFVVSGFLTRREIGTTPRQGRRTDDTKALPEGRGKRAEPVVADPVDAEMAEIEALLRKRGIT
jgi:heme exporter protein D